MSPTRRALLCAALAAGATVPAARAEGEALPQRNLVIELRWAGAERSAGQAAAAGGGVVVGTGGIEARGGVVLRSGQREAAADTVQRILVLNGGRASLRLTQAVPVQWLTVAITPRGPAAAVQTGWMDAGTAFELRPRWPGGAAATVEVAQQILTAADGRPGAGEALLTTLQLPLGEWTTVARSDSARQVAQRGTLSTREIQHSASGSLQMRISPP